MKRILILFIITLILCGAGTTWYVYQNAEGIIHPSLIPPDYYWLDDKATLYEETGIVAIADREFKIPVAYVDGRFKDGRMEGGVVLEYVLPDFKSKLEFSYKEKRQQLINEGFIRGMLLEDPATKAPFQYVIDSLRQRKRLTEYTGEFYGLEKWTAPKPEGTFATKPDDTFIEKSADGKILSYLSCSAPGTDKVPGCRHTFIDKGVQYSIRWKLSELPNWRRQRDAAIQFIDGFEVTNSK